MKRALVIQMLFFIAGIICGIGGYFFWQTIQAGNSETPVQVKEFPLLKYSYESLKSRTDYQSKIEFSNFVATESAFVSRKFVFLSDGKKVSGLAHIPNKCSEIQKCPIIVQIRGYADPLNYVAGYGTWRSAQEYAKAGFISLAPDFLGYGGSDLPSENVFEARFQTYTTVLNLFAAISSIPGADTDRIGVWGHSNGGQIALSFLEISGKSYPTTLWAPVTIYFPYSILFYTNDSEDHGKALRKNLSDFETDYDIEKFNLSNYFYLVNAPLLIHQGTADKSIPTEWTNETVRLLRNLGKDITYKTYSGADHNLVPYWNEVVSTDIKFFQENMGLTE
jgi:dipeptidyl aminopeptidase/acylaminoacyl peptidase